MSSGLRTPQRDPILDQLNIGEMTWSAAVQIIPSDAAFAGHRATEG